MDVRSELTEPQVQRVAAVGDGLFELSVTAESFQVAA